MRVPFSGVSLPDIDPDSSLEGRFANFARNGAFADMDILLKRMDTIVIIQLLTLTANSRGCRSRDSTARASLIRGPTRHWIKHEQPAGGGAHSESGPRPPIVQDTPAGYVSCRGSATFAGFWGTSLAPWVYVRAASPDPLELHFQGFWDIRRRGRGQQSLARYATWL